jgi:hypothetical protein
MQIYYKDINMQEEFKSQEEKVAFVNQEIAKGIEHIK